MTLHVPEKGIIVPKGQETVYTYDDVAKTVNEQLVKMGVDPEEFYVYPAHFDLIHPGGSKQPDVLLPMYVAVNKVTGWGLFFAKMGDLGIDNKIEVAKAAKAAEAKDA